ncbi:NAD+ synthase (glutamine-hydrolysing) [Ekhidna lutea]|uniref:Glutamine-dependent NAD(+) synthetase n=1 Tax=Ekhidna lutea TaxID=447679 RepID=A0A239LZQ2_EKHLU|nr:NAD(+) synthase [Ekhidna lutea]SNT35502.1 NAD+ synthase (glutamine-hydrolysing) [Ekhidna lutea]
MSQKLKLAGACLNQTPIDWANNLRNIKNAIDDAKKEGVDILCLPELCITGYGCEDLFLSQWLPTTALEKLDEIIPHTSGIAISVGLPIRIEGKNYNTTAFIADKQVKGFYAKQKLANDGVHYEPRWFTPWSAGKVDSFEFEGKSIPFGHITIEHKGLNIAFEICEDAWQPDRPCEHLKTKIDLILNPSASHFAFGKSEFREELVIKSSNQFDCVYLYCNLLGNEAGRMIYDGDVLIAQKGKLIGRNHRLWYHDYRLLTVEVDFEKNTATENIKPHYSNRNEEFSHAAGLALFDYCRKSRSKGFVLSLSGGADSSTIATLIGFAVRTALEQRGKPGLEKVLGFQLTGDTPEEITKQLLTTAYQATKNSSDATFNSAKNLAESLGATFYNWQIDAEVNEYRSTIEEAIERKLTWEQDDITLQNIQARTRAPIIWMLANLENKLLMATSNRSEGDVGYATMDGDTSGSISPIAGVDKHFILQWLKYAEHELGFTGLKDVNALTPTAELRPEDQHQTDEEDLMPYEALMRIEREAILHGRSPKQVYEALKADFNSDQLKDWIKKFYQLWTRNQWKRERYAPSFHFDDFNIDPRSWYRFPILSGGYMEELNTML